MTVATGYLSGSSLLAGVLTSTSLAVASVAAVVTGSYVERVVYSLWRSARTAGDPLAHLSYRWPCAKPQELLWILWGAHGQSEGSSVTKSEPCYAYWRNSDDRG